VIAYYDQFDIITFGCTGNGLQCLHVTENRAEVFHSPSPDTSGVTDGWVGRNTLDELELLAPLSSRMLCLLGRRKVKGR
jgi:hypothetical protein